MEGSQAKKNKYTERRKSPCKDLKSPGHAEVINVDIFMSNNLRVKQARSHGVRGMAVPRHELTTSHRGKPPRPSIALPNVPKLAARFTALNVVNR